jgi:hypothetical protein
VFIGSCCGDASPAQTLHVLAPGKNAASLWWSSAKPPVGVYALKADRASAANQRLIVGGFTRGSAGIYTLDLANKTAAQLATINMQFGYQHIKETEILYRRNVSSIKTGPGTWDLSIHIPEDANRPYLLCVSATGVRPGLPLPDGRRIHLVPDVFTLLGVSVGLAPYLTGTSGLLDSTGRVKAKLATSSLQPAANGTRLWFLVLTLDPKAPHGIKTITDPHVVKIE